MLVYRICGRPHTALDGEGARLYGARWNSPGNPAVYTSTHLSLAALEYLVHVDFDNLPIDLVWMEIEVPDGSSTEIFPDPVAPNEHDAAKFGDSWLATGRTLSLVVPSVVISIEKNIVLNPMHSEIGQTLIVQIQDFNFDDRLFKK